MFIVAHVAPHIEDGITYFYVSISIFFSPPKKKTKQKRVKEKSSSEKHTTRTGANIKQRWKCEMNGFQADVLIRFVAAFSLLLFVVLVCVVVVVPRLQIRSLLVCVLKFTLRYVEVCAHCIRTLEWSCQNSVLLFLCLFWLFAASPFRSFTSSRHRMPIYAKRYTWYNLLRVCILCEQVTITTWNPIVFDLSFVARICFKVKHMRAISLIPYTLFLFSKQFFHLSASLSLALLTPLFSRIDAKILSWCRLILNAFGVIILLQKINNFFSYFMWWWRQPRRIFVVDVVIFSVHISIVESDNSVRASPWWKDEK